MSVNIFAAFVIAFCILFSALGQIMLKMGMNQFERIDDISKVLDINILKKIFFNKYIIFAVCIMVLALFLSLIALSMMEVSFMNPLTSMTYVVIAVLAFTFLGENISIVRWSGIFMIVVGCFLITRS